MEPIKCVLPILSTEKSSASPDLVCGLAQLWKGFTANNEKARHALSLFENLSNIQPAGQLAAINRDELSFCSSSSAGTTATEGAYLGLQMESKSNLKKMASKLTRNWYNYILISKQVDNHKNRQAKAILRSELVKDCGDDSVKNAEAEFFKSERSTQASCACSLHKSK